MKRALDAAGAVLRRGLRVLGWTLLFGLLFGVFFLLLDWGVDQLAGTRLLRAVDRNQEQQHKLERAAMAAARLQDFKAEVERLESDLDELRRILPDTPEVEQLEKDVRDSGARAGVRVVAIEPGPAEERDLYAVLPLEVEVRGSWAAVDEFCSQVSQQVRRTRPTALQLERTADEYTGRLQLEAFYYSLPPAS